MTVETTPFAIQTGGETAEHFRRLLDALMGGRSAYFESSDFLVTAQGTPNMSVAVAGGRIVVRGTESTYQGAYFGENRGSTTLTITASDPTNARRDLIVASVRDAQYSGVSNDFDVRVVTGTPAASPADPATPANAFVLARVTVAAGATSVTGANITDLRSSTTTGQGPWRRPLGLLGRTTRTSNTSTFTSLVYFDTVTVNPLPNRLLRVVLHTNVRSDMGATGVSVGIASNAGTILNQAFRLISTIGVADQITVEHFMSSGAGGSTMFKISAYTTNTNTAYIHAAATTATYLSVYDAGPV